MGITTRTGSTDIESVKLAHVVLCFFAASPEVATSVNRGSNLGGRFTQRRGAGEQGEVGFVAGDL